MSEQVTAYTAQKRAVEVQAKSGIYPDHIVLVSFTHPEGDPDPRYQPVVIAGLTKLQADKIQTVIEDVFWRGKMAGVTWAARRLIEAETARILQAAGVTIPPSVVPVLEEV